MNIMSTVLVVAPIIVAGAAPFVAVHIGGKTFDDHDEPEHDEPNDDTTQLPRVADGPYNY